MVNRRFHMFLLGNFYTLEYLTRKSGKASLPSSNWGGEAVERSEIVEKRRAFTLPGYRTLAELDFDGDWISPYQIISKSAAGPCLVAYHWLDAPSVEKHRLVLRELGYLPGIPFNKVMDLALAYAGLARSDIYVTQAFHLLPCTDRSERIPQRHVDASFEAITRHELETRYVIALGDAAASACRRHGIEAVEVCHPSSRTHGTYAEKAEIIGRALKGRPIGRRNLH
jgi:hypothetical protein